METPPSSGRSGRTGKRAGRLRPRGSSPRAGVKKGEQKGGCPLVASLVIEQTVPLLAVSLSPRAGNAGTMGSPCSSLYAISGVDGNMEKGTAPLSRAGERISGRAGGLFFCAKPGRGGPAPLQGCELCPRPLLILRLSESSPEPLPFAERSTTTPPLRVGLPEGKAQRRGRAVCAKADSVGGKTRLLPFRIIPPTGSLAGLRPYLTDSPSRGE